MNLMESKSADKGKGIKKSIKMVADIIYEDPLGRIATQWKGEARCDNNQSK